MRANYSGKRQIIFCAVIFTAFLFVTSTIFAQTKRAGQTGQVFAFQNLMPTGATVSQSDRIFVNYPRWENKVDFTVAEIAGGRERRRGFS